MTGLGDENLSGDGHDMEAELALSSEDSLPWLESEEYEEDAGGIDTARIIGFAAIVLVLIGAGLGGAWWFTTRGQQTEYVADGSTVQAPDTPYKQRPENPGGKQFAGTGNVAPAVGEGEVREGVLRNKLPDPEPLPEPVASATPVEPEPSSTAAPSISTLPSGEAPVAETGVSVQVGAYRSRSRAEAGWVTLQRQTTALNGVKRRIVKAEADIGTVYRLQALPGDLTAARTLCQALKDDGVACQVKR